VPGAGDTPLLVKAQVRDNRRMTSHPRVTANARNWLIGIAYLASYVALDALSYVQPMLKLGITPWNPDAGLTLAFLVIRGWRQAPWTVAAAFAAEIFVHGAPAPMFTLLCASGVVAAGYGTLAYVLANRQFDPLLASRRTAVEFGCATALTALAVSCGYAAAFVAAGVLSINSAADAVVRNWVGDLNGILTVTPLLLARPSVARAWRVLRGSRGLIAVQGVVLAVLLWVVFRARPSGDLPLVYVLFLPVVWITLTWGVLGASAVTLLIQIVLIAAAAPRLSAGTLIEVQYLLLTLALTGVLLGAILSERANALAQVAAGEAEQRALLDAAPDAVLATDAAGYITSANLAAKQLFEAPDTAIQNTHVVRWLPDLRLAADTERMRLAGVRANAQRFPAEVACVRLNAPAREGYLLIVRDMTEHDRAQMQLRERDTALARAMRFALAGELATALTHELNQPITALVSYLKSVEILLEPLEMRDSRLIDTLHKAARESHRASDVIRRLRDFYSGAAANVSRVDIRVLVHGVLSAFTDRAARLDIEVTHDIRLAEEVCTDGIQLQMVLHNLIGNSIDALADGPSATRRVHITIAALQDTMRIVVEDTGPGVPEEIRSQLFEPFVTSKVDGMGLGLAISRSLLRSQGGELSLDSSLSTGCRFVVELPLAANITKVVA
jgi:signal transduction histidine kinase